MSERVAREAGLLSSPHAGAHIIRVEMLLRGEANVLILKLHADYFFF